MPIVQPPLFHCSRLIQVRTKPKNNHKKMYSFHFALYNPKLTNSII